jgi:hypothetical protein
MATLTVQDIPANGADSGTITFTASSGGGDDFPNDGRVLLIVKYGGTATTETVQIEGVPSIDSGRDGTQTIAAGTSVEKMAGPFKARNWNTGSGLVQITYPGGVTGVSVAAVRFTLG